MSELQKCPVCDGRGFVKGNFYDVAGETCSFGDYAKRQQSSTICRYCRGKGITKYEEEKHMNEHRATETAFKNGYKQGTVDAVRKMHDIIEERCIKGGIYPAFVKNTISKVVEEMLEENT